MNPLLREARAASEADAKARGRLILWPRDENFWEFETGEGSCSLCDFRGLVLFADTSGGEYPDTAICFDCVKRALRQRGQKQYVPAGVQHG